MDSRKKYLGDGVYVFASEDGQLVLTTENGADVTNVIYLEHEVLDALISYVRADREQRSMVALLVAVLRKVRGPEIVTVSREDLASAGRFALHRVDMMDGTVCLRAMEVPR